MHDRVWIPRSRKEIERRLRMWGVTRIHGLRLRDVSKRRLVKEYYKQVLRIRAQREQKLTPQTLPLPGLGDGGQILPV